ncbi:MAG: 4Fe-4S binding protein, partial [Lachnospiraceae bacterium]|nr:4Fe-4S binding protein [Lachnospiraceae bacterium]
PYPLHVRLGGAEMGIITHTNTHGFYVTERCSQCGKCFSECPQSCIDIIEGKVTINQAHCLHCGRCYEICPEKAILKRGR